MDLLAFIPRVLLYQLTSPFLFVPAIAVGWFARTRVQIILGAVAVGCVSIALSFLQPMPEGSSLVYGLMPLTFISPLVWAFATAALKRRLQREDPAAAPAANLARKAIRAVIGVVIGAPVGGALGALVGSLAADHFRISNFEGGAGYYVMFLYVLPGILIGAIVGAVVLLRWRG